MGRRGKFEALGAAAAPILLVRDLTLWPENEARFKALFNRLICCSQMQNLLLFCVIWAIRGLPCNPLKILAKLT
jgi:hypothetical protein